MNVVSSWIISITVAVLLGVLVEIIMPQGRTSRLLKSVIAILCMLVVISPLKGINVKELNFSNLFGDIKIDENFIKDRELEQITSIQKRIETTLGQVGYQNVNVKIDGEISSGNLQINNVYVDLENIVITSENLNINKYTNIMGVIKTVIDVEERQVIFYE